METVCWESFCELRLGKLERSWLREKGGGCGASERSLARVEPRDEKVVTETEGRGGRSCRGREHSDGMASRPS